MAWVHDPQRCHQIFDVRWNTGEPLTVWDEIFTNITSANACLLCTVSIFWYIFLYIASSRRPKIFIEQKALDTIAHLCDGDARIGLNSLQLAVQAQVTSARCNSSGEDGSQEILIKEEHIKEGLQRSHILYDKAGKFRCAYVFSVVSVIWVVSRTCCNLEHL